MPDWSASMQQTFEYYVVDPGTWKDVRRINNVLSSTIDRDGEAETLGSATIDVAESLGECYIRMYLITIQNGIREKHPLGTFLIQTPSTSFDGKMASVSLDAYTPLLELKESLPPIGYFVPKKINDESVNTMDMAYQIVRDRVRAPVIKPTCKDTMYYDFVADTSDTWISFITDMIAGSKYELALDEMGRILFSPVQETASLQPVWTYDDSNSSILQPDITLERDLYGIPNAVEVVYSQGLDYYYSKVVNDDPNSPISIPNRGREIIYRDTSPSLMGIITQDKIDEYATKLLRDLSTLEYTLSYTHGYCPVRIGDCVRLNYERAGLTDIKAKVITQSIHCGSGCQVSETAKFTTKLWG